MSHEALSQRAYYDRVHGMWSRHPEVFGHDHPFYTQAFSRPGLLTALELISKAHPHRFAYYHPCLSRVLAGYSEHGQDTAPQSPGSMVLPLPEAPPAVAAFIDHQPPGGTIPSPPPLTGTPPIEHLDDVVPAPEPHAALMAVFGVAHVLAFRWTRRWVRRQALARP